MLHCSIKVSRRRRFDGVAGWLSKRFSNLPDMRCLYKCLKYIKYSKVDVISRRVTSEKCCTAALEIPYTSHPGLEIKRDPPMA